MNGWVIAATVVGSWSTVSVVVGVVLGHAIAGRPLRTRSAALASVTPDLAIDDAAVPAAVAV